MVGQQHVQMEWQNNHSEAHRSMDDDFEVSLEVLAAPSSRTLVSTGMLYAHELLAVTPVVKTFAKAKTAIYLSY